MVETVKYLGVHITERLGFEEQAKKYMTKPYRLLESYVEYLGLTVDMDAPLSRNYIRV